MFNIALRCHIDFGTKEDILYLIIYTDDLLTNISERNSIYLPQTYKFCAKTKGINFLIFEQACFMFVKNIVKNHSELFMLLLFLLRYGTI